MILTPVRLPPCLVAAIPTAPVSAPISAAAPAISALVPSPRPGVGAEQEQQPQQTGPKQRRRQEGEGLVKGDKGCASRCEDLSVLPLLIIKT